MRSTWLCVLAVGGLLALGGCIDLDGSGEPIGVEVENRSGETVHLAVSCDGIERSLGVLADDGRRTVASQALCIDDAGDLLTDGNHLVAEDSDGRLVDRRPLPQEVDPPDLWRIDPPSPAPPRRAARR